MIEQFSLIDNRIFNARRSCVRDDFQINLDNVLYRLLQYDSILLKKAMYVGRDNFEQILNTNGKQLFAVSILKFQNTSSFKNFNYF